MKCYICDSETTLIKGNYTCQNLTITDVPMKKCLKCGETSFVSLTSKILEIGFSNLEKKTISYVDAVKLADTDSHVYCTECFYGRDLIRSITETTDCPDNCNNCNPYNPEDSTRYKERPMYIPHWI